MKQNPEKKLIQEKIKNRFEQTYNRLENFDIKKLYEFLKKGYASYKPPSDTQLEPVTFRLSSTDKMAIYKLIQLKESQKTNG